MSGYATHSVNGPLVDLETLANSPILAFDVESSGYHIGTDVPYGFSVACEPTSSYYASIHDAFFTSLLADESKLKIAFNAKHDRGMLKKIGITVDNLCDPMIAAHLLENYALSLQYLAGVYLHRDIVDFVQLEKPLEYMTTQELADYSGPHSESALALWYELERGLKRLGLLSVFWNIEMPLVPMLSDMELNGIAVDLDTLNLLGEEFDGKIATLVKGLDYWSGRPGMNHNSPDQVSDLLYKKLGLPVGRVTKTGDRPSVDKRYLETIKNKHSYILMYLFFKELKTLKNSYVDSLRKQIVSGRIHGSFNQTRTTTGRLSSSDPNLQKIPTRTTIGKRIRTAFVAPLGSKLVKVDYNQVELRMMAHWSQDPALLAAFRAGRDIHEETAIRAYKDAKRRPEGKTLDFKLIYLGGTKAEQEMLFSIYPRVREWSRETALMLRQNLYARTLGGRIRTIEELEMYNSNRVIAHGVREGISTLIQGSSAEEVKKGMARAYKQLKGSDAKSELQVHDEVVYEVPDNQVNDLIGVIRETYPTNELSIPLTVDVEVGQNWGQMVKIKEGEKYEQFR